MIRQYLNVGNYKYCADFISYDDQSFLTRSSSKFVMLRNFQLMNDIVVDDNIYFIEKDIFEKYRDSLINKKDNDIIVFPTNKEGMHYARTYNIFNDTFIEDDIIKYLSVYNIYDKVNDPETGVYTFTEKDIPCNIIKIYHPNIKPNNNLIIHIENIINNIHMHYICNTYDNFNYNSYEEFRYDNNIYSEFITCKIPDVKSLFDRIPINDNGKINYDYKTYFKEDLNIIGDASEKNKAFIENTVILLNSDNKRASSDDEVIAQYVPLALLTQPFLIDESTNEAGQKIFKKLYFKYKFTIETNYITTPINLSLFPYSEIDENNNIYLLNTEQSPGTCTFNEEYKFSLSARCCFGENGIISLISAFDYPDKEFFEDAYIDSSFGEAYCFYNHIYDKKIYSINNIGRTMVELYKKELDEIRAINYISEEQIQNIVRDNPLTLRYWKTSGKSREEYYIDILKEKRFEHFLEEYMDEYGVNIDFFGFKIILASDSNLTHKIFEYDYSLLEEYQKQVLHEILNDAESSSFFEDIFSTLLRTGIFYFNINNIFTDWSQLPDNIVCSITFKDRFIGVEIPSNKVIISKEKFKYMTSIGETPRLESLKSINNNMKEVSLNIEQSPELNEILNQISGDNADIIRGQIKQFIKDHNHMINFVNNVNCSIKKLDDVKDNISASGLNKTQIIYKPIFYKVQTAQSIKLKYQQTQNIAIDLHEYMSKVDLFMITLNNNTYKEIGRNANYVIFTINANNLSENSGTYQIYNQDSEYITYGSWSIIM